MKKRGIAVVLVLLVLFMGTGLLHAQGLYFETRRSGRDVPSAKVSYMPGMAKIVTPTGHIVLLRVDKEMVNFVNPANKTYTELSFDDLENLSPEQKRSLEGRSHGGKNRRDGRALDRDVVKTDETRTINGFKCTKYEIRREGKVTETVWATQEVQGADALRRDIEKILDRAGSVAPMSQPLARLMSEVDGFPIEVEARGATTTLTNIKEQSISESEFQVPSGYTRASTPRQGGAGEERK